jgi:hypothetical protein
MESLPWFKKIKCSELLSLVRVTGECFSLTFHEEVEKRAGK